MTAQTYLIEMTFAPFASLLSPAEAAGFMERTVLPTLEACEKLQESGRILAGGTALGAGGFAFIIRVDSPAELEEAVAGLPLWPRSQTRVLPLGTFSARAATARKRLAAAKAQLEPAAARN
jgi:hypothetical protein